MPSISTPPAVAPAAAQRREPLQGYASMQDVPEAPQREALERLYAARTDYKDRSPEAQATLKAMHDASAAELAAKAMDRYPLSLDDDPPSSLGRLLGNIGAGIDGTFAALFGGGEPDLDSWSSLHGELKDVTSELDRTGLRHDDAKNAEDRRDLAGLAQCLQVRHEKAVDAMAKRTLDADANGESGRDMGGPAAAALARLGNALSGK